MRRAVLAVASCLLVAIASASGVPARTPVDPQLAAEIAKIRAIDNHAHPLKVVVEGETDTDFDAIPLEGLEEFTQRLIINIAL